PRRSGPFSALGPGHGWQRRAVCLAAGLRSDDARRADPMAPAVAELEPSAPHDEPDRCLREPLVQRLGGAGSRQRYVTRMLRIVISGHQAAAKTPILTR